MFGALNRFISRLDSDPQQQQIKTPSDAHGFHVLKNTNQELAIEPWFDFIIGINGRTIVCTPLLCFNACSSLTPPAQDNPDANLFATEVRNCSGSTISLGVYSAKVSNIMRQTLAALPRALLTRLYCRGNASAKFTLRSLQIPRVLGYPYTGPP